MRHAHQVRVQRDGEYARSLRRLAREALERRFETLCHFARAVLLDRVDHAVVGLEAVRHRYDAAVPRLHPVGGIVDRPLAQVVEAELLQDVRRIERLLQPRSEPAAHAPSGVALDGGFRRHDHRALVGHALHGLLESAVADPFPAGIEYAFREPRIDLDHVGIDRAARRQPGEHAKESAACPRAGRISAQPQLGRSGTAPCPCGGVRMPRGMGWSNGHTSTFTTTWTMSGLPSGGARRGARRPRRRGCVAVA